MEEVDKAYLAGLLDGEGTIGLTERGSKITPFVSFPSTSDELIMVAVSLTSMTPGMPCRVQLRRRAKEHQANYSVVHWRGKSALKLLGQVGPWLREPFKRKKAELLVTEFIVNPHGVVFTPGQRAQLLVFKERFLAVGCGRIR